MRSFGEEVEALRDKGEGDPHSEVGAQQCECEIHEFVGEKLTC